MLSKITDRSFLSPVVAFTFVPAALTGILLLFHIHFTGIKDIHNWMGLAFVVCSAFHIAVNWKVFTTYLSKKSTRYALVFAVALTFVCCIIGINNNSLTHDYHKTQYSHIQIY